MAEATKEKEEKKTRKIKFMNNEDPDVDLAFTYVSKDDVAENYHLYPGYEYELPAGVVKHLNNLAYPVYKTEQDSNTGQIIHKQVGSFNRFSCHPVE